MSVVSVSINSFQKTQDPDSFDQQKVYLQIMLLALCELFKLFCQSVESKASALQGFQSVMEEMEKVTERKVPNAGPIDPIAFTQLQNISVNNTKSLVDTDKTDKKGDLIKKLLKLLETLLHSLPKKSQDALKKTLKYGETE